MNISVNTQEHLALSYLAHVYLHQERLLAAHQHNGARRQRLLKRLQELTGSNDIPRAEWLERRRFAIKQLRNEVRGELQDLLAPWTPGPNEAAEITFGTADCFAPLPPEISAWDPDRDQGARLSELALDILDLAGRAIALPTQ